MLQQHFSGQIHAIINPCWRGARVVELDGLENRCARKGTEGSNPSLSATKKGS